jgi:hypothetical protein
MKFDQILNELTSNLNQTQPQTTPGTPAATNTTPQPSHPNKPVQPVTPIKPTTPTNNNQKVDAKNPVVAELVKAQNPDTVLAALAKLGIVTAK